MSVVERGEEADGADRRRRQDRPAVGLVVEADVARDDRHVERRAGRADAADAADELAHDLRLLGVAEVEVVGRRERPRAGRREVAVGLGHRLHAAALGVGAAVARRHVGGEGDGLVGAVDAHDAGVGAGDDGGVAHHLLVVLRARPRRGSA